MSFQITILKVLAGSPKKRATLDELRRAVAILMTSGPDWIARTRRIAALAPDLNIFSESLVIRDDDGWEITETGLAILISLEASLQTKAAISETDQTTSYAGAITGIKPPTNARRRKLRRIRSGHRGHESAVG